MSSKETTVEKSIVDQLNFGSKTAKHVGWESWEFTVVGPHLVEVTNASYGSQKDDHVYQVGIDERDGVPVPAECECPADMYSDDYDCKHKLALATVGGPTVLNAAVDFSSLEPAPSTSQSTEGRADRFKADGGTVTEAESKEETCPNGDPRCEGPDGHELPCFECYCYREN